MLMSNLTRKVRNLVFYVFAYCCSYLKCDLLYDVGLIIGTYVLRACLVLSLWNDFVETPNDRHNFIILLFDVFVLVEYWFPYLYWFVCYCVMSSAFTLVDQICVCYEHLWRRTRWCKSYECTKEDENQWEVLSIWSTSQTASILSSLWWQRRQVFSRDQHKN